MLSIKMKMGPRVTRNLEPGIGLIADEILHLDLRSGELRRA
jgi:hypothetical protein